MYSPDSKNLLNNANETHDIIDLDAKINWITISKVYPPHDIIIESMLKYYGIPVKIFRKEVSQLPFATGPLAEAAIAVPEAKVEEARDLLENKDSLE
ncbi:MAG: hypothetical protein ABFD08_14580 [Syntrophomonas sp.]